MNLSNEALKRLYLPVNNATAKDLPPEVVARLAKVKLISAEWLDRKAKVLCAWEKAKKAEAKRAPRETRNPLPLEDEFAEDFVADQVRFLELISSIRSLFSTERDDWDTWVDAGGKLSIEDRAYCCLYVMIMTPRTKDRSVGPLVLGMMKDGITSAAKMIESFAEGTGVEDCLRALALRIKSAGMQHKSASFILQATLVCIAVGRTPNTYVELFSMTGVGMKVSDVICNEIFGTVVGIPIDVHMIRIFRVIGWVSPSVKSGDDVAVQLMSWVPKHLWLSLNKIFAGMGQILQSRSKDRENFVKLLKENAEEEWMLELIEKILQISQYKVSSSNIK